MLHPLNGSSIIRHISFHLISTLIQPPDKELRKWSPLQYASAILSAVVVPLTASATEKATAQRPPFRTFLWPLCTGLWQAGMSRRCLFQGALNGSLLTRNACSCHLFCDVLNLGFHSIESILRRLSQFRPLEWICDGVKSCRSKIHAWVARFYNNFSGDIKGKYCLNALLHKRPWDSQHAMETTLPPILRPWINRFVKITYMRVRFGTRTSLVRQPGNTPTGDQLADGNLPKWNKGYKDWAIQKFHPHYNDGSYQCVWILRTDALCF